MKLRKLLAAVLVGVMTVSSLAISAFAADEKATVPAPGEFDPAGKDYVAQMYVQTGGSWVFRNTWADETYGTAVGYENADKLSNVEGETASVNDGTFTDVKLEGNGTYTVTLDKPNFTKTAGGNTTEPTNFNLIGVSTNIPASADASEGGPVKFTDVKITVNDNLTFTYPEGSCDPDAIAKGSYISILGVNIWNKDICTDANAALGGEDVWPGTVDKITITFTVAGFNYDKAVEATTAEETTAAAADTATKAAGTAKTDSSSSNGLPTPAIIGIVAAVVVVVVVIVVVATSKKKKAN